MGRSSLFGGLLLRAADRADAAGMAAALAAASNGLPRDLDVSRLQIKLREQGAILELSPPGQARNLVE